MRDSPAPEEVRDSGAPEAERELSLLLGELTEREDSVGLLSLVLLGLEAEELFEVEELLEELLGLRDEEEDEERELLDLEDEVEREELLLVLLTLKG